MDNKFINNYFLLNIICLIVIEAILVLHVIFAELYYTGHIFFGGFILLYLYTNIVNFSLANLLLFPSIMVFLFFVLLMITVIIFVINIFALHVNKTFKERIKLVYRAAVTKSIMHQNHFLYYDMDKRLQEFNIDGNIYRIMAPGSFEYQYYFVPNSEGELLKFNLVKDLIYK